MTRVEPETLEEELLAVRRVRARLAVERIRAKAKAEGLDRMRMDDIDAGIAEARAILVTGNPRHFPKRACKDVRVLSPAGLLDLLRRSV